MRLTFSTEPLYDAEQVDALLGSFYNALRHLKDIPNRDCHDLGGHYFCEMSRKTIGILLCRHYPREEDEGNYNCPVNRSHHLLHFYGGKLKCFESGRTLIGKLEEAIKLAMHEDSDKEVPFMDVYKYKEMLERERRKKLDRYVRGY